jgi:soluble lytic murein transglycosylase-like protein
MPHIRLATGLKRIFGAWTLLLLMAPAAASMQQPPDDDSFYTSLRHAMARNDGFDDTFDAEVWLKDMSRRLAEKLPQRGERLDLLETVHREASRLHIPPELVLAVIDVESDFDRFAISSAGARGYMQVMPFWLQKIGRPADNLFNPQINIRVGCMILRYYLDKEKGDMMRALSRYNGNTDSSSYSNRVLRVLSTRWFRQ